MGTPSDILKRKADAAREEREARIMSARRALRRAVTRTAELGLSLPLAVRDVQQTALARDTLLAQLPQGGLIVSLDSDGAPPGVIVLDLQFLSALVEIQTLGQVFDKTASDRAITRTDAAVAMPLIDGTLRGFDQLMLGQEGAMPLSGYHFGSWIKDLRTLHASMPDGDYTLFHLTVILGHGDRVGTLSLALPVLPDPPAPEEDPPHPKARLRDEVLEAPTRLDTILHRLHMNLDEVSALKEGDILPLPLSCLSEVRLHVGDRQTVASGTLGQIAGNRAIRLSGFGNPRLAGAVSGLEQLPDMGAVDLADAGLLEPKRPRKPPPSDPMPPVDAAQQLPETAPGAATPAAKAPDPSPAAPPALADPTGTEALLSELGLSDLGEGGASDLSLGPIGEESRETGSFMADWPPPEGDG